MGFEDEVEDVHQKDISVEVEKGVSAHILAQDNPWEVGFQLAAAIDNAFVLGYSLFIMDFLGWVGGSICLIGGLFLSYYANCLLASLAVIDGVRYYRFRDITASQWGSFGWWLTVSMQWLNVIAGNIGLAILAGQSLKGVYKQYNDSMDIKLPSWICMAGGYLIVQALIVPDLHYLRQMSIFAAFCSVVFCFICTGIAAKDGANSPPGSILYDTGLGEDTPTKVFNIMGALSTVAFAYSTVIIPEIQATLREPVVKNFVTKSLLVTYGAGAPIFVVMTYVGFWAYGSNVAPNLIENLSGPAWAITLAWVTVFIQSVISLQIYSAPIYESFDTAFYGPGGNWAFRNVLIRIAYRIPYVIFTCFVAALLPFFGDFIVLVGAMSVLPLNFVVTFILYAQVNKHLSSLYKYFLYVMAVLFAVITVVSSVAALRYIIVDSIHFSVFADN